MSLQIMQVMQPLQLATFSYVDYTGTDYSYPEKSIKNGSLNSRFGYLSDARNVSIP